MGGKSKAEGKVREMQRRERVGEGKVLKWDAGGGGELRDREGRGLEGGRLGLGNVCIYTCFFF